MTKDKKENLKNTVEVLTTQIGFSPRAPEVEDDLRDESVTRTHPDAEERAHEMANLAPNSPCLIALSGLQMGNTIVLQNETTIIGRSADCTIAVDDSSVSRQHAVIKLQSGDVYMIKDLGSTNGTFIGRNKISEQELLENDRIVLGLNTVFKFVFHDRVDQEYQERLYNSSVRDALTGIFNRTYIDQKLASDLSYARRHNAPLSVLLIDLDHFKSVNDTHGHPTGDSVLVDVTKVIKDVIRVEDSLGRYGGEEFAVIAPGTNFAGAKRMAERIVKRLSEVPMESLAPGENKFFITASIGVVTIDMEHLADAEMLIAIADRNLYQAKASGRNRVIGTVFDELEL